MSPYRVALKRATRVRPMIAVAALLAVAFLTSVTASAAAATVNAHGSAGQVYATGLAPGAPGAIVAYLESGAGGAPPVSADGCASRRAALALARIFADSSFFAIKRNISPRFSLAFAFGLPTRFRIYFFYHRK